MPKVELLQNQNLSQSMKPNSSVSKKTNTPKFSETLSEMISQVDGLQKNAANSVEKFIAGEESNLHEVMASVEEAQLSFQLMLEIRNKLIESYQELIRMQV
ncbi:MAG: flagellar hook-basal body complex protein FliE [bacterium]